MPATPPPHPTPPHPTPPHPTPPHLQTAFRFAQLYKERKAQGRTVSFIEAQSAQLMLRLLRDNLRRSVMTRSGWAGSMVAFNRAAEQQVCAALRGRGWVEDAKSTPHPSPLTPHPHPSPCVQPCPRAG
jgi:hypothetical protein